MLYTELEMLFNTVSIFFNVVFFVSALSFTMYYQQQPGNIVYNVKGAVIVLQIFPLGRQTVSNTQINLLIGTLFRIWHRENITEL